MTRSVAGVGRGEVGMFLACWAVRCVSFWPMRRAGGRAMLEAVRALWKPDLIVAIQSVFGPGWDPVFEVFSLLGGAQLVIIAVCWARWFGGRELTCRLLLATLIGLATNLLFDAVHPTPRPDDPRIRVATQIPISSFPSGHLVTCVSLWGTFAAAGWISPWLVAVFAVLIALGRLGLGQHYPGDLLGGVVIGLVILAVVGWVWPHLRAVVLRSTPGQRLMAGGAVAALALVGTLFISHDRWALLGVLGGAAIGLPVEEGFVGYEPVAQPWRTRLLQGAMGFAGVGVCVGGMAVLDEVKFLSDLVIPTLLALWILVGAPWVFVRFGWAKQGEERRETMRLVVGVARR